MMTLRRSRKANSNKRKMLSEVDENFLSDSGFLASKIHSQTTSKKEGLHVRFRLQPTFFWAPKGDSKREKAPNSLFCMRR